MYHTLRHWQHAQVQGPGASSTAVADEGQISEQLIARMRQSITEALGAEEVHVHDVQGGMRTWGDSVVPCSQPTPPDTHTR